MEWDQPSKLSMGSPGTQTLTVASFWTASSDAPSDARPISWENWAKLGSAKSGTWPRSSWQVSLEKENKEISWSVFVVEWKSSTTEQIQSLVLNYLISKRQKSVNRVWLKPTEHVMLTLHKFISSDFQMRLSKIKIQAPHLWGNWILN